MSPRRSSRARTSQPSPLVPTQTTSSNSSVTSDRAQRATRSNLKAPSPQRSVPRSQSQDDTTDDAVKAPPRRTRSGANEIKEAPLLMEDNLDEEEDDGQDENEVTRCICRQVDFPGLASPLSDLLRKSNYAHVAGHSIGDFFLQCDECKVWQHGGCVGIVDQDHSPDEYYCEDCGRDLHKLGISPEGQRFSRYIPIMSEPPYRQSPKPSVRVGKSKDARPRQATDAQQKRPAGRSTMNSREQDDIDRAIEMSKAAAQTAAPTDASTTSSRPGKRARDEGHELNASNKRPRTNSHSPVTETKAEEISDSELPDADVESTPRSKIRGAAARNHQAKEAREARDRQRQAAASARQARSERRRGDESDHEDFKDENAAAASPPAETPALARANKKKPPIGKRGRGVREAGPQDQESPETDGDETHLNANPHHTRARSRSRSVARGDRAAETRGGATPNGQSATRVGFNVREAAGNPRGRDGHGYNSVFDDGGLLNKPSKVKNFNEKRTSMNEMRKRVAAISEFVGRAQNDRPSSKSTSTSRSGSETGTGGNTGNGSATSNSVVATDTSSTLGNHKKKELLDIVNNEGGQDFGSLSMEAMMENIRLRTSAWQELFGRYGDK